MIRYTLHLSQHHSNFFPHYQYAKYAKKDEGAATLLQFDFEYNNKLLQYQSVTWKTPTAATTSRNAWTGYKFNPKANSTESDMDVQYIWWRDAVCSTLIPS